MSVMTNCQNVVQLSDGEHGNHLAHDTWTSLREAVCSSFLPHTSCYAGMLALSPVMAHARS